MIFSFMVIIGRVCEVNIGIVFGFFINRNILIGVLGMEV